MSPDTTGEDETRIRKPVIFSSRNTTPIRMHRGDSAPISSCNLGKELISSFNVSQVKAFSDP